MRCSFVFCQEIFFEVVQQNFACGQNATMMCIVSHVMLVRTMCVLYNLCRTESYFHHGRHQSFAGKVGSSVGTCVRVQTHCHVTHFCSQTSVLTKLIVGSSRIRTNSPSSAILTQSCRKVLSGVNKTGENAKVTLSTCPPLYCCLATNFESLQHG